MKVRWVFYEKRQVMYIKYILIQRESICTLFLSINTYNLENILHLFLNTKNEKNNHKSKFPVSHFFVSFGFFSADDSFDVQDSDIDS